MTDYAALQAKIAADHAGDTDEQIVVALNDKNIVGKQPISSFEVKRYMFLNNCWIAVKKGTSIAAETAMDGLDLFEHFDIRISENETALIDVLDDLVSDELIPEFQEQHKTGVLALGVMMESWADQNYQREILIKDVKAARE